MSGLGYDPLALQAARRDLVPGRGRGLADPVAEGGCGVTGFACSIPVPGKHIFEPSCQMHNRGNGKGGGLAMVGFEPEALGVDRETLESHYLLTVAYLDPDCREELEARFIEPMFEVARADQFDSIDDFQDIPSLEVCPPMVWRYFVRAKGEALAAFTNNKNLGTLSPEAIEDEFVYQNSFELNKTFYESGSSQRAFVLSHGKNMMVLKIVGYAEEVVRYYKLEEFKAHVWIAHQRYPTKGRVWHPGGAHPFVGLHEALVHNGDFANYHAVGEYLRQRNIHPLFLTDTEVSVLLFDLLHRGYGYPLEYVIEALAPTGELDLDQVPAEKRAVYEAIQRHHLHAAPDGPWFFIIARNDPRSGDHQLLGITDTAMLRPQVFAFQDGEVQVGLICSEKQAIDATLQSLHQEDERISPVADMYWNARGGSHTDGGAFMFTVGSDGNGGRKLTCTDKFGRIIEPPADQSPRMTAPPPLVQGALDELPEFASPAELAENLIARMATADPERIARICSGLVELAETEPGAALSGFNGLLDRRYETGRLRRRSVLDALHQGLRTLFERVPPITRTGPLVRIDWANQIALRPPQEGEEALVINAFDFPPEGDECDARLLVKAHELGWRRFLVYGLKGQRYLGCGLGPATEEVRIDAYDSSGDYLASGIDGLTIVVHGNGQDQLGQIMKAGKLVVHGDVGQTFLYGAKGGEVFVLGNGAGRPMINAVGKPRVVINGTCLDYLAESFMAGDPLNGGGFVILNGIKHDHHGRIVPLESPYPGSNLFSLASGGAIYVRDPGRVLIEEQLNGGSFQAFGPADWELIRPYLEENERLFGIPVEELLSVDGRVQGPDRIYRKVGAQGATSLDSAGLEEWA